jgi:probable O-glycosylation ligase (exosortase A-associated)
MGYQSSAPRDLEDWFMEKGWLFTNALTYGGSLVALFNPFVGLLVYVAFAILRPEDLWSWSVGQNLDTGHSRVVAIAMLLGWLMRGCGNWRFGKAWPILICLILFWVMALLSMTNALYYSVAYEFIDRLTKIVVPFIVGLSLLNSVARLRALAWVILACQGYLAFEFNINYLSGWNRVRLNGFSYLDNNGVGIAMDTVIGLAFFLGISAPKWWQKALALGSALLMLHVILFSFSRGSVLGLIVTGGTAFVLIPKTLKHYLVLLVVVLIGLQLAGKEVRERFSSSFESSAERDFAAQERLDLWNACSSVMNQQPLLGCGPANWPMIASRYGFPPGKAAHSTWMQTGAELGIPALAALIGFFGFTVKRLWRFARDKEKMTDPWFRDAARMVIASIIGFVVSGQFVTLSLLETVYYVTLLGAGTLKVASLHYPAQTQAVQPIAASAPGLNPVLSR